MSAKRDKFMLLCHELTEFCLAHTGRVFNCWARETILLYVAFAAVKGCLFVKRTGGKICAVAFAFPESQARIDAGATFDWKLPKESDCLLIREVIADQETCRDFGKIAARQWPQMRRFFTFRSKPELKIVELKPEMMRRFYGYELKGVV